MAKPKIYILHGWAVDQFNQTKWQPLIDELDQAKIETVFLKIPGLTGPLDQVWGLPDFVNWLADQLPAKGQVILLGHSFGGQLAIRFAAEYPERVAKLILVDSAGIRDHSLKATLKRNLFWLAAKVGKLLFRFEAARRLLYLLARERDYYNAPPLLKRSMSLILDDEIVADLPRISCPTLLIWGENDTATPLKFGKLKNKAIANSRLVVINGARHSPQFTHVDQVAQEIAEFVL
jgi:pimeloyl-ACP methyl ester carboxylesterase